MAEFIVNYAWYVPLCIIGLGLFFSMIPRIESFITYTFNGVYTTVQTKYYDYWASKKTLNDCFGDQYLKWKKGDTIYFKINRHNDGVGELETFHDKQVVIYHETSNKLIFICPAKVIQNETAEERIHLEKAKEYHRDVFPVISEQNQSTFLLSE